MTITGSLVQSVKSVFLQHSFSLADRMSTHCSDPSHMSKFLKLFSMESLCEHVGCHFVCVAVFQFHGVVADLLSNEMIFYSYMQFLAAILPFDDVFAML